jgi:hypothetical protein
MIVLPVFFVAKFENSNFIHKKNMSTFNKRPAFSASLNSNQHLSPSLIEFKNLQNTVRKLEAICNRLTEEIQELHHNHETLASEVERQFQFESASKNNIPFNVQGFKEFLENDFQNRLNVASNNYAWIHQIRYFHLFYQSFIII